MDNTDAPSTTDIVRIHSECTTIWIMNLYRLSRVLKHGYTNPLNMCVGHRISCIFFSRKASDIDGLCVLVG